MRKYKKWARHHTCEPYLEEIIQTPWPSPEEQAKYVGQYIGVDDEGNIVAHGTVEDVVRNAPGSILSYVSDGPSFYVLAAAS